MCTFVKKISARCYIAQTEIVKVCIGSPNMARNEQVYAHQQVNINNNNNLQQVNFPKHLWGY